MVECKFPHSSNITEARAKVFVALLGHVNPVIEKNVYGLLPSPITLGSSCYYKKTVNQFFVCIPRCGQALRFHP